MLKKYLRSAKHQLFPLKEFEIHDNSILPAKHLRFNSVEFRNNTFYIQTAEMEAQRVIDRLGCNKKSRILEIGCGKGRFAIGLLRLLGPINYIGLDVHLPSIKWCQKYITTLDPSYQFAHLDVASIRYHQNGKPIDDNFTFDLTDKSIDIIYIWGVFTNMASDVMKIYLNDLKRMLKPSGRVFFTAFVEENVPEISVNPESYVIDEYTGPLQVVRYEKNYMFSLISKAGLVIDEFIYGEEFDGQSEFYLSNPG